MCKNRVQHAAGIMHPAAKPIVLVGEAGWAIVQNVSDRALTQKSALTRAIYSFEPGDVRFVDKRDVGRLISYKINGTPAFVEVERGAVDAAS